MRQRHRSSIGSGGSVGSTLAEVFANWAQLNILLDSQSLDELLSQGDPAARKLVEYRITDTFHMFRSPFEAEDADLREVTELLKQYNEANSLTALELGAETYRPVPFNYAMANMERVAALVYGRASLSDVEADSILLVFMQAALVRACDPALTGILVTADETLLSKRLWFESHFPGVPVNIMSVGEALEFMDLFAKHRGKYYTGPNSTTKTAFGWYLMSFKTKLPAYELPWSAVVHRLPLSNGRDILQALANRFKDLLRAIDEMGFQYYLGADNDTAERTAYHFNYFVILVTGIFDSLARLSLACYDLEVAGGPSRVSLRKSAGKDFLKELKKANSDLSAVVCGKRKFIELFYPLRDAIAHADRPQQGALEYHGPEGRWEANVIQIPADVARMIRDLDQRLAGESLSEWGSHPAWLQPFPFVKAVTPKLVDFCTDFLETMGFPKRLKDYPDVERKLHEVNATEDRKAIRNELACFKQDHLGF